MKKVIIITYESFKKEALPFAVEALEHIIVNHSWIIDIEIIDLIEFQSSFGQVMLEVQNAEV